MASPRVCIVGLGAMGSAASYHLACRGYSVVGLDRFHPPHAFGSSHGDTRIIREAYFEDPVYVPMVQRAYALWTDVEQRTGMRLYRRTGGAMIGAPDSELVQGALRSAREHGLAHELVDARTIRSRYPGLQSPDGMVGVLEPRAGVLFPERCISAHLDLAREAGATLRFDEPVLRWEANAGDVRVHTPHGENRCDYLVVTAGAWTTTLLPDLALPFSVERQVLYWFASRGAPDVLAPERCPVHLWQFDEGGFFYGFPDFGNGIKVARHHHGRIVAPDDVDREVSADEIADIRGLVRRFVPSADGALRKSAVCVYTNTPDGHFWIDRHPAHANVLIVSACSGHGFKFASVIGEIVADRIDGAPPRFELSRFAAR